MELSLNLVYHLRSSNVEKFQVVDTQNMAHSMTAGGRHDLFAGVESTWGQRENFQHDIGKDGRIMFSIVATN